MPYETKRNRFPFFVISKDIMKAQCVIIERRCDAVRAMHGAGLQREHVVYYARCSTCLLRTACRQLLCMWR
jgi:hypothetical protein